MRKPKHASGARRDAPIQVKLVESERTATHVLARAHAVRMGLSEDDASLSAYIRALVNADARGLVRWDAFPAASMRALAPTPAPASASRPEVTTRIVVPEARGKVAGKGPVRLWMDLSDVWHDAAREARVPVLEGEGGYTRVRLNGTAEEYQRLLGLMLMQRDAGTSPTTKAGVTRAIKRVEWALSVLRSGK